METGAKVGENKAWENSLYGSALTAAENYTEDRPGLHGNVSSIKSTKHPRTSFLNALRGQKDAFPSSNSSLRYKRRTYHEYGVPQRIPMPTRNTHFDPNLPVQRQRLRPAAYGSGPQIYARKDITGSENPYRNQLVDRVDSPFNIQPSLPDTMNNLQRYPVIPGMLSLR